MYACTGLGFCWSVQLLDECVQPRVESCLLPQPDTHVRMHAHTPHTHTHIHTRTHTHTHTHTHIRTRTHTHAYTHSRNTFAHNKTTRAHTTRAHQSFPRTSSACRGRPRARMQSTRFITRSSRADSATYAMRARDACCGGRDRGRPRTCFSRSSSKRASDAEAAITRRPSVMSCTVRALRRLPHPRMYAAYPHPLAQPRHVLVLLGPPLLQRVKSCAPRVTHAPTTASGACTTRPHHTGRRA